jgi:hypothetical protein
MRFAAISASALALAVSVFGQETTVGFDAISAPALGEVVPAGTDYTIVWSASTVYTGDITISLLGGASQGTLNVVDTIASKCKTQPPRDPTASVLLTRSQQPASTAASASTVGQSTSL